MYFWNFYLLLSYIYICGVIAPYCPIYICGVIAPYCPIYICGVIVPYRPIYIYICGVISVVLLLLPVYIWFVDLVLCVLQARFVFGNNLTPSTLVVRLEEAKCMYTTSEALNLADLFRHDITMAAENVRIMFTPSLGYTGPKYE